MKLISLNVARPRLALYKGATINTGIFKQPVEGRDPGIVVEVYQRGYRLGDSVIRPARVVVAA